MAVKDTKVMTGGPKEPKSLGEELVLATESAGGSTRMLRAAQYCHEEHCPSLPAYFIPTNETIRIPDEEETSFPQHAETTDIEL